MQRIAPLVPFGDGQRQRRIKDRGQRVHERHIRLHARIAFRSHVGDRPHQQAARRAAVRHRTQRRGQSGALQRARGVDEILKRMLLVEQVPLLVPGASHLAAAADVRHGVQHAAVEHADARHRESRIGADLVRAVARDEHGGIAGRHVTSPYQRDGDAFAVARGDPHPAFHVVARIETTQHGGAFEQTVLAGVRIVVMQLAGARVAGERVAHARRVIRGVATNADRIQAARIPRHAVGGGAVRRRHRPTRDAMHGRSLALRGGGRVQFAPDLGAFLVDLVHGFVDVPIVLQRVRHQFGEPPWPAGQEILGGGLLRHHRDVRQAFRTVLQCDEMPMDRDTLDAQTMRAPQNGGIARIRIRGADRHGGGARLHVVAMLATVGRSDRHARTFAQPVWRLVRPHIDHIDLEIRI